jgi:hypothetical protein
VLVSREAVGFSDNLTNNQPPGRGGRAAGRLPPSVSHDAKRKRVARDFVGDGVAVSMAVLGPRDGGCRADAVGARLKLAEEAGLPEETINVADDSWT